MVVYEGLTHANVRRWRMNEVNNCGFIAMSREKSDLTPRREPRPLRRLLVKDQNNRPEVNQEVRAVRRILLSNQWLGGREGVEAVEVSHQEDRFRTLILWTTEKRRKKRKREPREMMTKSNQNRDRRSVNDGDQKWLSALRVTVTST